MRSFFFFSKYYKLPPFCDQNWIMGLARIHANATPNAFSFLFLPFYIGLLTCFSHKNDLLKQVKLRDLQATSYLNKTFMMGSCEGSSRLAAHEHVGV